MKKMLWSVGMACMLGCTGTGEGPGGQALSGVEPEGEEECPVVCSPYDPSDCRPVCPEPPPDAALPEDPYQVGGDQQPTPGALDAGTPADPYALGAPTDGRGDGHRAS